MNNQTAQTAQAQERFEGWCFVEIMGHNVFAGFVSERTIGGTAMLQVDVPEVDQEHPAFTKLFSSGAIYAITPTTETHAREAAAQIRVRPVTLYILPEPKRLPVAQVADREMEELDMEASDDHYLDDDDENDDSPF